MMKNKKPALERVGGWEAVRLLLLTVIIGAWEFLNLSFRKLWRGHRRKAPNDPPVQLIDSSIGTHCYIKVMGIKYHYVESGPKKADNLVVILGDAPGGGAGAGAGLSSLCGRLASAGHRTVALDLRGTGGSEGGGRRELAPPRVVSQLYELLKALGAEPERPVALVGHGIGGMLVWYLVHCHGDIVSRFAVIGAPHPNLYWQYPPAAFCKDLLYFIQWPWLPEHWLAGASEGAGAGGGRAGDDAAAESLRWAASRAQDWSGPLNYVRGAAWWRIRRGARVSPPALLVGAESGAGGGAGALVASGEYCAAPTLRLVSRLHPALHACSPDLPPLLLRFLLEGSESKNESSTDASPRGGLVGRMIGAVAGRGRELTAAVSRARHVLPLSPPALA